jgi:hypothetical protein
MLFQLLLKYLTQVPAANLRCRQFPSCGHLLNFGWCCYLREQPYKALNATGCLSGLAR